MNKARELIGNKFKASPGWFYRFKKRAWIKRRMATGIIQKITIES